MAHYQVGGNETSVVVYRNYYNKHLENIELMLIDVGTEKCIPGYECGSALEKRTECILHKVIKGKGIFIVDGVEHKLEAGDCFYFSAANEVYYKSDEEDPMEYIWVTFLGIKSTVIMSTTMFAEKHVVKDSEDRIIENGINDIFNTAANGGNLYTITGLLYLLLGKIVDVYYSKRQLNTFGIYYIDQAIEYIEKNYMNRCSVEEVAGYLGLTRTYLYKIFKKYMDVSPTDYIENFRMEVACKLLLKGSIGISECAAAVGYDDRSYFSRVFKKVNGMSPREFINSNTD